MLACVTRNWFQIIQVNIRSKIKYQNIFFSTTQPSCIISYEGRTIITNLSKKRNLETKARVVCGVAKLRLGLLPTTGLPAFISGNYDL